MSLSEPKHLKRVCCVSGKNFAIDRFKIFKYNEIAKNRSREATFRNGTSQTPELDAETSFLSNRIRFKASNILFSTVALKTVKTNFSFGLQVRRKNGGNEKEKSAALLDCEYPGRLEFGGVHRTELHNQYSLTNVLAEAQVMGPPNEIKEINRISNVQSVSPLPDVVVKVNGSTSQRPHETFLSIGLQVLLPFLVAGMGMVGAGIYLDHVQSWPVFQNVSEIIILVPSLLGLKGNLEMTLASRLSTEANLGHMDDSKERWIMILGNLILVQCQAIVVGLLSSVVAVVMVAALRQQFNLTHTLMLCACSLITASVASLILGLITAAVISLSRFLNINPDNVATPIAASLGDITSLALLSWIASLLYESIGYWWISPTVMVFYILSIPFWFWVTKNNRYTQSVLYTGWTPVIIAMVISTLGGFILDLMVSTYRGLAVFQPVINGVGGNLVSVQSSRLSTELHKQTSLGTLPSDAKILISPINAFFSKRTYALTARVLMSLVIPGHLVFIYTISWVQKGEVVLTPAFVTSYLIVSLMQVAVLLYMSCILTHYFWSRKIDPDNSTIPYLTALGDLLGIILLGICFKFLSIIGDEPTTAP